MRSILQVSSFYNIILSFLDDLDSVYIYLTNYEMLLAYHMWKLLVLNQDITPEIKKQTDSILLINMIIFLWKPADANCEQDVGKLTSSRFSLLNG